MITGSGGSTYIQCNNYNETQTTISGGNSDSVISTTQQQQQQQQKVSNETQQQSSTPSKPLPPKPSTTKKSTKNVSSNIDLLSDVDFSSATSLPAPALQPQPASIVSSKSDISSVSSSTSKILQPQVLQQQQQITELSQTQQHNESSLTSSTVQEPSILATAAGAALDTIYQASDLNDQRKLSCDNISVCSDLSSLDQNFEWDSISIQSGGGGSSSGLQQLSPQHKLFDLKSNQNQNPFDDPKVLKYFHKEVEHYEKMIESLNVKMLNGNTPLITKWNELQDLLAKDEIKRTTTIGKLFPEKNRSNDCIPYDHARVILEQSTDNYINAAYVKVRLMK